MSLKVICIKSSTFVQTVNNPSVDKPRRFLVVSLNKRKEIDYVFSPAASGVIDEFGNFLDKNMGIQIATKTNKVQAQ